MTPARLVGGLAATAAAFVAYGTLVERRWYALRHTTLPVLRPGATRPLRVLHLSDLHLLPGQPHAHAFVRACAATGPDVLVATGDLLGTGGVTDDVVALLGDVRAGRPAVAVLGSHDRHVAQFKSPLQYFTKPDQRLLGPRQDTRRLTDGLRAEGWHVLCNERALVPTAAGALDVVGLDDPHIELDRPELVDWSPPAQPVTLRLGLVHAPYRRALDVFDRHAFDLVLAGHTHGGQVRLPGVGALVDNCDLPLRQARGVSRWGDELWLHVSAGIGHSPFAPFRFACRPEATLLDLVPAFAGDDARTYTSRAARDVAQLG